MYKFHPYSRRIDPNEMGIGLSMKRMIAKELIDLMILWITYAKFDER